TSLCHPTRLRPLSIKEYAALQQFPTAWKFAGSTHQKYIQIGNAVPVGLGAALGRMLCAVMKKTSETKRLDKTKLGSVVCADPILQGRLESRKRTMLHPAHLRKNADPDAARRWLSRVAA